MKCPNCGIDNFQDARKCIGCGYNFINPEANKEPEKKPVNSSTNLASIFNTTTVTPGNEPNEVLFAEDLLQPKTEVLDMATLNTVQNNQPAQPANNFGNLTSQGANTPQPTLTSSQPNPMPVNQAAPVQPQNRFFNNSVQNVSNTTNNDNNFKNKVTNLIQKPKLNKKFPVKPIVITLSILIVGVIILVLAKKVVFTPKTENPPSLFNGSVLIPVKKDGKYGYINSDGQMVIEPKYEYASAYQGNYAIIKEQGKSEYKLIDVNGEVKKATSNINRLDYFPEYDVWIIDYKLYNANLELLTDEEVIVNYSSLIEGYLTWNNEANDHLGVMDMTGRVIYTYDDSKQKAHPSILFDVPEVDYKFEDKYCIVNIYGFGYSIINCETGIKVYDLTNSTITKLNNNLFQIEDPLTNLTKLVYVQNDEIAYQVDATKYTMTYNDDGYIVITGIEPGVKTLEDGTQITIYANTEYIDITTGKKTTTIPVYSGSKTNKTEWEKMTGINKKTCGDGKYTLVLNNATLLDCEYEEMDFFSNSLYDYLKTESKEYIIAKKGSKYYLVNLLDGSEVATFNTKLVNKSNISTFVYYTDTSNKTVIYNLLSNNSISVSGEVQVSMFPTYVSLTYSDKVEYYNTDLKLIYTQNEL